MPTTPFDTFSDGDLIEAHHVSEMHLPIQNIERGKAFFAEADVMASTSTSYEAALTPAPDATVLTGMFIHLKVPETNTAGSPDVTLDLNGAGAVPILKRDGQSLEAGDLLEGEMIALIYDEEGSGSFRLLSSGGDNGPITWDDLPFEQAIGNTILGGGGSLGYNTGLYNTAVGREALRENTTADQNTGVGFFALLANTTGEHNTAVGSQALPVNTTGSYNTAVGMGAMLNNTTGNINVAIGESALVSSTESEANVAVGFQAAFNTTTGSSNVAIGAYALSANTEGSGNIAIGRECLAASDGGQNTAIGFIAMRDTVGGSSNVAVGFGALTSNVSGSANCAVGREALFSSTGNENTGMGYTALRDNQGDYNCAFGSGCLTVNTTGYSNSALGTSALASNTTGYENCALGTGALGANTTGIRNVALGSIVAPANTSGYDNVAIGWNALASNTAGFNNTVLGYGAGATLTGSSNIVIGANADVLEAGEDNQINIGDCLLRNGPRQNVSLRSGSSAFANSSDTAIVDLTDLRGWIGFSDDQDGWCRLRVKPSGITIEASSTDWVASSTPASGEVGLYFSSGSLRMVLGSAAARAIGFTDHTTAF